MAKLLTQSYLGSDLGRGHPGMEDNPSAIMADPEFIKLNPGLSQIAQEAGAALLSLSNSSDVIEQLTDWIAQDKDAMDFIDGKADPWGMKVNPAYKKIELPRAEWPLLDTYIPKTEQRRAGRRTRRLLQPARGAGHHAAQDRRRRCWTRGPTCRPAATSTQHHPHSTSSAGSTGSRTARGSCSASSASATPPGTGCASAALETKRARTSRRRNASLSPRR